MKLNLQNKILLPVVLTLLLLVGGSAFLLSHFLTERFEGNIVSMLAAGNNILGKNIHSIITAYQGVLRSTAAMPTIRRFDSSKDLFPSEDVNTLLRQLSDVFPRFSQFNFANTRGDIIASSNKATIGTVNVLDQNFFISAVNGEEVISEPLISKSTGQKSVIISSPVKDFLDTISGVIYAIIPCTMIVNDSIKNVKMSETGYAYIVDGKSGLMIAHNILDKIQRMNMFEYQPWMKTLSRDESGIKKDYVDSGGNGRLAVYYKEPSSGWIAVSCIATSEIKSQERFIRNVIFLLTLGTAVIVGIIICYIIRPVTRDILKTSHFARNVTRGQTDSSLDIKRDDELGVLCDSLNKMVVSLKSFVHREIKTTEDYRKHLAAMRDSMIMTLADLVESRDQGTGQHIKKTAAYVEIIMRELQRERVFPQKITDSYVRKVVRSAPLHDIGKITVSDVILNKPGKLTDEEFSIMKRHAAAGGEIIQHIIDITPDSQYLVIAKDLASSHHERWDGKGYPDGLKGEDIPLSARIMAVADVFDALVSDRPYKRGFPLEKAFSIIREESGSHFDPRVVDAFFAAQEEIIAAVSELKTHVSG